CLRRAAELGFPAAKADYGYALVQRMDGAADPAVGRRLVTEAAEQNDPDGLIRMGLLYIYGAGGVGRDPTEGARLIQRAMDLGMVPAYRPFVQALEDQHQYERARAVAEAGVRAGDAWLSG